MESTPRFQYDTLISYIKDFINLGEGNNCIDFLAKFSASSTMDFMVDTTTLIFCQTYQTFSSQTLFTGVIYWLRSWIFMMLFTNKPINLHYVYI